MMIELMLAAMMTPFGEKVTAENAWREYPRPQMVRENWTCLNGYWDYRVVANTLSRLETNGTARTTYWGLDSEVARGRILVPFAFESALSGVGRTIEPHETMIYSRTFAAKRRPGYRTLIHFEGVDLRTQVFVNGSEATDVPHVGGQTPFTVDATDFLRDGENELRVVVQDPTSEMGTMYAGGKQSLRPGSCFYTRVSGIWQTVWTEEVPETYIRGYKVVTDIDKGVVWFEFDVSRPAYGDTPVVRVSVEGTEATSVGGSRVGIPLPKGFTCWSPENPKLYDFTAVCGADAVRGYFAMRKFERRRDAKGVWRFFLNNRPYYLLGTLDQGWWPDGLLTPPSAEACAFDIRTLKDCGFNMMRKHIKVEPRIYYHLCDRLGIVVLQDMPSGAPGRIQVYTTQDALQMENRYAAYRGEWKGIVDHLVNVPSIVMWIPYNEAWGQPGERLTRDTLLWTRRYDPTRLVGGPSGWNDYDGGDLVMTDKGWKIHREPFASRPDPCADTVDRHDYEADAPKLFTNVQERVAFLGEFGGFGLKVPGHLWDEKAAWGYVDTGKAVDVAAAQKRYLDLMDRLARAAEVSYGGSVYTQTTDVESEINGLMTYDRRVLKYDAAKLREAHARIRAAVEK